jgi:hypothetical protein
MNILAVLSNIEENWYWVKCLFIKSLVENGCSANKKSPERCSGLLFGRMARFSSCLVLHDADRFGCFGYFQEVDAARNLVDIDRC